MATFQSANHSNNQTSSASNHNNHTNQQQQNSNGDNAVNKKEEFRRYLERTGVLDALTKVLVGLYEEPDRPSNAVDYIRRYLGNASNVDVSGLQRENEDLKQRVEKLKKQLNDSTNHHHNYHHHRGQQQHNQQQQQQPHQQQQPVSSSSSSKPAPQSSQK